LYGVVQNVFGLLCWSYTDAMKCQFWVKEMEVQSKVARKLLMWAAISISHVKIYLRDHPCYSRLRWWKQSRSLKHWILTQLWCSWSPKRILNIILAVEVSNLKVYHAW